MCVNACFNVFAVNSFKAVNANACNGLNAVAYDKALNVSSVEDKKAFNGFACFCWNTCKACNKRLLNVFYLCIYGFT